MKPKTTSPETLLIGAAIAAAAGLVLWQIFKPKAASAGQATPGGSVDTNAGGGGSGGGGGGGGGGSGSTPAGQGAGQKMEGDACSVSADCVGYGLECYQGVCINTAKYATNVPDGAPCNFDYMCQSGKCEGGAFWTKGTCAAH